MKRLALLALTALMALSGCAPAKVPASSKVPTMPQLTEAQKMQLVDMDLGGYLNMPAVLNLVSFPENATYANDDYQLTLTAVYADYADKRLLVKVEPISQKAKEFLRQSQEENQPQYTEDHMRDRLTRTPYLDIPREDDTIPFYSNRENITHQEESDVLYYYLIADLPETEGFLFFSSDRVDWETQTYLDTLDAVRGRALKVDLTSPIQKPLIFDLNLPLGDTGVVLDTLTLGVLSTQLTYHAPLEGDNAVLDTLDQSLKDVSTAWVNQDGTVTDLSLFHGPGGSQTETDDENGVVTGISWSHSHAPVFPDQVASLSFNGVSYTPRS